MATEKIAITIEKGLVRKLDSLVRHKRFVNRSRAIQEALEDKIGRMEQTRLAEECAKLDPREERALADEGFKRDMESWPEY